MRRFGGAERSRGENDIFNAQKGKKEAGNGSSRHLCLVSHFLLSFSLVENPIFLGLMWVYAGFGALMAVKFGREFYICGAANAHLVPFPAPAIQ